MTADLRLFLDPYLERIAYSGPRSPTLDTLRALHLRHTATIAFENLSPLLGWPVSLDLTSLERKLIHEGRGGYCFEHNLLFSHVLQALGFDVRGLAARVLWNSADDAITKRSHMLLRVDIGGETYIADVGFGGQTLTGPLRLVPEVEQTTPHEPFRLLQSGNEYRLQSRIEDSWKSLYRFDLSEQHAIDYEAANYYLSTHPSSIFRTTLRAARPDADRRHTLLNNQYAVHHLHCLTERRTLTSVAELCQTLEEAFLLRLPEGPELHAALARFV
jgi:N-hydroxyarylamine O-acetyltransferase